MELGDNVHRPLDGREWSDALLRQALDRAGSEGFGPVVVIESTGSTNADAINQVREGAPEGFAVIANEQTQGRGRLERVWVSPPGAGLAMSVVLRPTAPLATWGWLPLIAGMAVVAGLGEQGVESRLKWPNDIVIAGPSRDGGPGPRKLGGLLLERVVGEHPADSGAAVVGIGINVDVREDELPVPTATSTFLEGVAVRREPLAVDVLGHLRLLLMSWQQAEGDAELSGVASTYREVCLTLGEQVRVTRPPGDDLLGVASAIDSAGRLIVTDGDGLSTTVAAGDVHHVRSR